MSDNHEIDKSKEKKGYQITIIGRGDTIFIECHREETILEAMTRQGIYMSAACGGRGTCGKCKIQFLDGLIPITLHDQQKFTPKELEEGYRLSCKAYPTSDCRIKLSESDEKDFQIITEKEPETPFIHTENSSYAIAIDLGTTTIAVSLVEINCKCIVHTDTTVNRQRAYGADVIARIQASNNGKQSELKDCIRKDLLTEIKAVIDTAAIPKDKIEKIAIAGNTTMGHLLLGYSCLTLGSYPFTPVNIKTTELTFEEVMDSDYLKAPVILLPGITTFVGADIVAGLLSCDYDRTDRINLFLDLGTNGEMAIGNRNKILVSSTAAGPAFEGGNITCGVGSIAGAISHINIKDKPYISTIADKVPVGICGTGVIEIAAELYRNGFIDKTGLLKEDYFEHGYRLAVDSEGKEITFTQRDIREIQLAKAAVRAGIEILVKRYGCNYQDIGTLYLAGGFGYKINVDKAMEIGLLPEELRGRIKAIGNSSLQGAVKFLTETDAKDRMEYLIETAEEITLSNDEDFNDLYIDHMNFN